MDSAKRRVKLLEQRKQVLAAQKEACAPFERHLKKISIQLAVARRQEGKENWQKVIADGCSDLIANWQYYGIEQRTISGLPVRPRAVETDLRQIYLPRIHEIYCNFKLTEDVEHVHLFLSWRNWKNNRWHEEHIAHFGHKLSKDEVIACLQKLRAESHLCRFGTLLEY